MRYLLGLVVLFITSCGASTPSQTSFVTPIELQTLVDDFALALGRPVLTPIQFGNELDFQRFMLGPDTVGVCSMNETTGLNQVYILRSYWDGASNEARWAVVFHELGHCELDREHLNTLDNNGCPHSIMRWELNSVIDCLKSHERATYDYERELFSP